MTNKARHTFDDDEILRNSLKIQKILRGASKTARKLSAQLSNDRGIFTPEKVAPLFRHPSQSQCLTHAGSQPSPHHHCDQPFVTRSLDFPFSARFHRDDTDTPPPPLPAPPFPRHASPPHDAQPVFRIAIERDGDMPISSPPTNTTVLRTGETSFSPPPERHCHCHSLTNRYEAVAIDTMVSNLTFLPLRHGGL